MSTEPPAWDDLRLLLEVHRRGSFFAAGVALGLSTSTVARRISSLERTLGRALVYRTPKGASLESEALTLVALAEDFEQTLLAHHRDRTTPYEGTVRVSMPDGFVTLAAEAVAAVRAKHPEIEVELIVENRFVDLASREADMGLRGARSTSASLVDKKLGDVVTAFYASDAYLAARLPSRTLSAVDYATQDFITDESAMRPSGFSAWLVERGAKHFPVRSNAVEGRIAAARNGMGIAVLGVLDAERFADLQRITAETEIAPVRFYLTMQKDLKKVPRMRVVAEALQSVCTAYLAQQDAIEARWRASNDARARTLP